MTKLEALSKTRNMWNWLSRNPSQSKDDYLNEVLKIPYISGDRPFNDNFCCQFAWEVCYSKDDELKAKNFHEIDENTGCYSDICKYCPLPTICTHMRKQGSDYQIYCDAPSLYFSWYTNQECLNTRKEIAKKIAREAYLAMKKEELNA